MGYRCAPGVTIYDYIFLDTFLHLFNDTTGTINSRAKTNIGNVTNEPFLNERIFEYLFVLMTKH